ncbi:MAG: cation:proton antiporter [Sandaracinaceae bacterium]|nr:cation:proton antiporter [Sandaracinaceae bacterium]
MSTVDGFLLVIAAIFVIGIVGELIFERTGVPDVIWLIVVGIVIGPVAGWVPRRELIEIAPYFGALTLVVVLFDGGSELRLAELGRAAPRAMLLAVLGFSMSAGVMALASMLAHWAGWLPTWGWLQAVTLGAITGGSSSVVIMPAVRKAGLDAKIANLVNLESALTDVLCVVVTGACIQLHLTHSTGAGAGAIALAKSFGIGLGIGGVTGILALLILRRLTQGHYGYPLVLGALLVLYVVIDALEGSAALGILTAAVIVGNAPALSKQMGLAKRAFLARGIQNVHDQITFFVKSFFFTFIGAMLAPPWGLIALGVLLGLAALAARVPAAFLATLGSGWTHTERGLVSVSLPRGMAAGVLAMMPWTAQMPGTEDLPIVVFAFVLTTILSFAIGFPIFKRRMPKESLRSTEPSEPPHPIAPPSARTVEERADERAEPRTGAAPDVAATHLDDVPSDAATDAMPPDVTVPEDRASPGDRERLPS